MTAAAAVGGDIPEQQAEWAPVEPLRSGVSPPAASPHLRQQPLRWVCQPLRDLLDRFCNPRCLCFSDMRPPPHSFPPHNASRVRRSQRVEPSLQMEGLRGKRWSRTSLRIDPHFQFSTLPDLLDRRRRRVLRRWIHSSCAVLRRPRLHFRCLYRKDTRQLGTRSQGRSYSNIKDGKGVDASWYQGQYEDLPTPLSHMQPI